MAVVNLFCWFGVLAVVLSLVPTQHKVLICQDFAVFMHFCQDCNVKFTLCWLKAMSVEYISRDSLGA